MLHKHPQISRTGDPWYLKCFFNASSLKSVLKAEFTASQLAHKGTGTRRAMYYPEPEGQVLERGKLQPQVFSLPVHKMQG